MERFPRSARRFIGVADVDDGQSRVVHRGPSESGYYFRCRWADWIPQPPQYVSFGGRQAAIMETVCGDYSVEKV